MKKAPPDPLPEWVLALVAAIQKSENDRWERSVSGVGRESQFLALVPEHVRQTARRWGQ